MTYPLTTKVIRFLQVMLMNGFAQGNIEHELWNSNKDQVFLCFFSSTYSNAVLEGEFKVESSRFMLIVLMLTPPWFFHLFFKLDSRYLW